MALFEIIKKDKDDSNIIWRYPKRDFNTLSQLIVHDSQEALFFANGKALDLFGAGKYTLTTNNIPLLRNIIEIPTGMRSPFHCEVYFIDKSEQVSKWGTSSKIEFLDPKYNFPIAIGACGEMRFTIEDSRKILLKLVGIKKGFDSTNVDEFFNSCILVKVKSYIAQIIKQENICIFEIDQQLEKFSEELRNKLNEDFLEFGIRLNKFFVTTIAKPEDDKQYLEFKELYFKQTIAVANAELEQKIGIIEEETDARRKIIASQAEATKRAQEGYTYQEEKSYEIGAKVADNQAVGQFTNMGVGIGVMSGVGSQVGDHVGKQVATAFTSVTSSIYCSNCGTANDSNTSYCKHCGNKLQRNKICSNCNSVLSDDSIFCSKCGERVG